MRKSFVRALLFTVFALLTVSSYANWQCRVHNARGQAWIGVAPTRAGASANAIQFCSRGSNYARNCVIDYCNGGAGGGASSGNWQCNATNARGQFWYGTGPSREIAAANASRFCTAHSAYARNCVIKGCFTK